MARHKISVESAAALAATTNFASLVAASGVGFKLRRITLGVRAGASVPTSQQLTVAVYRATARGTATTTTAGLPMDPNSATSGITGVDSAWSVQPTLAANPIIKLSFNSQSGVDYPIEGLEELVVAAGTANGLCFQNIGNALPASHLYTLDLEWEE